MQVRSDDEQFQNLDDNNSGEVMESVIRNQKQIKQKKSLQQVIIRQVVNPNQKNNLLENQYYQIQVLRESTQIKKVANRRFSDFDLLFQILFRQYKGYILPAFPENGISSYVKSKVSITKDDKFLKQRINMVQRFLSILINQPTFNLETCKQMKEFFSQKQFDLFKKRQKQKSQGVIANSWTKIMNYIKFNQEGKHKITLHQLLEQKKNFQKLYEYTKTFISLIQQQKNQCKILEQKNLQLKDISIYFQKQKRVIQQQQQNLKKLRQIQFELYCQNQDYQMVFKLLKQLQNMKDDESNNLSIQKAQMILSKQLINFKSKKKEVLKQTTSNLNKILQSISNTDKKIYAIIQNNSKPQQKF